MMGRDRLWFCQHAARSGARNRYLASLLAPRVLQPFLWALYCLASELDAIRGRVSNETLGALRLQWWRESLSQICAEPSATARPGGHPALCVLGGAIASHHPRMAAQFAPLFDALIDAHEQMPAICPPGTATLPEAAMQNLAPGRATHYLSAPAYAQGQAGIEAVIFRIAGLFLAPDFFHNGECATRLCEPAGTIYALFRMCRKAREDDFPLPQPDIAGLRACRADIISCIGREWAHFTAAWPGRRVLLPAFLALRPCAPHRFEAMMQVPSSRRFLAEALEPLRDQWDILSGYLAGQIEPGRPGR